MSITTAGDIVRKAMSKILVLGTQDTLASADLQDGLDALNAMLDSWWNESLAVYAIKQENFPLTANVASYTVGPAATWNTTRPTRIVNAFARYQNVDYPVTPIDRLQYDPIPYKTTGSRYGTCGVRIDGTPEFIDAVLSNLKPLLAGEGIHTRLELARHEVDGSGIGKALHNAVPKAEVCYIRLHERGREGAMYQAIVAGASERAAERVETDDPGLD